MPEQPSMLEDAVVKAKRLTADLDRDAAAMKSAVNSVTASSSSTFSDVSIAEGERVIAAAAECSRRLLQALHESADMQAKSL